MPRAKAVGNCVFSVDYEYLFDCLPAAKTHETAQPPCCAGCCKPANSSLGDAGRTVCASGCAALQQLVAGPQTDKPMAQPVPPSPLFHFGPGPIEFFNEQNLTLPSAPPQPLPTPPCPPAWRVDAGHGLRLSVPACGPLPLAMTPAQHPTNGIVVVEMAVDTCPVAHAQNPLLGTWYRDTGMGVIAVTFTRDEMKLCMSTREDAKLVTLTLTAHYTVTKDGLVYGAITGADVDVKCGGKCDTGIGMEQAELSLMLQELADQPFSFRAKMTSAGMMVSQLKAAPFDGADGKGFMVLGGLYKCAKDGRVPEPRAVDTKSGCLPGTTTVPVNPACPRYATPVPVDAPPMPYAQPVTSEPVQRIGIDFNFNPPMMTPPGVVGLPSCPTPVAPACTDPMKSMATDVFNQMLQTAGGPVCGGMTLPSPRYLQHYPQYFPPEPPFQLPRELASCGTMPTGTQTVAVKPGIIGAWYREIGSKRCVVKIAADHFTVTVSEAREEDGETMTAHLTFTADYQLTRDGLTAIGLITSVDGKLEGELQDGESEDVLRQIGELQKALEDKPFAMTLRVYGDVLVIGNVRMPTVGERMEAEPAVYVGGRYKVLGDKPLPKLKAVKVTEPKGPPYGPPVPLPPGPGLPGVYGAPLPLPPCVPVPYNGPAFGPVYPSGPLPYPPGTPGVIGPPTVPGSVAPTPACPTPAQTNDLLPPQGVPARPVSGTTPAPLARPTEDTAPVPSMTAPTEPVPQMPEPVEPGVRIHVPALGPIALALDYAVPLNNGPKDTKQTFNFSVGVFGDPRMSEPVKPEPSVPQMPQPVEPTPQVQMVPPVAVPPELGQATPPAPAAKDAVKLAVVGFKRRYSSDPNVRMRQLLDQTEDLRPMQNEWRRFWFNDQPSHLTPEPAKKQKKAKPSSDPVGRVQGVIDQSAELKRIRDEVAAREAQNKGHWQLFTFTTGVFGSQ
jgi:hypothetical protein